MKLRLVLLGFLALLLVSPLTAPVGAQPAYRPHEDPRLATPKRDAYYWMVYYGQIIDSLLLQDVGTARALLEEMRYASLPTRTETLIPTLNNLVMLMVDGIDTVQTKLNEVAGLLAANEAQEASARAYQARLTLLGLESQIPNLSAAAQEVADRLGATAAAPGSPERLAFESVLQRVQQLLASYREGLSNVEDLRGTIEAMASRLVPTLLAMDVGSDSAFIGEEIRVSGKLVAENRPLGGRTVTLMSSLNTSAPTTTRADGSYDTVFRVPFAYVASISVWAVYSPEKDDLGSLQGARSPTVQVRLRFYLTGLEVAWPRVAHPGLPMVVTGEVTSQGETQPALRHLRLLFDGTVLTEADVPGSFQIEVVSPDEVTLGTHIVRAEVAPDGLYSGASRESSLELAVLPTTVQVRVPRVALAPWWLPVSGKLSSPRGPVERARVQLTLKGHSVSGFSTSSGDYSTSLRLPLSLTLFGPQKLAVFADPEMPWGASVTAQRNVFVVNLADIGLLLAVATAVGLVALRRRRSPEATPSVLLSAEPVLERPAPSPPAQAGPAGPRDRVLLAYARATQGVAVRAGQQTAPNVTLREFLRQVRPALGDADAAYADLTRAAETVLYSEATIGEPEAARAEALARQTTEVIGRG